MRRLSCLIALLACLVLALPAFAAPQKADAISGISSEKVLDIVKANKGKLVFINFFATWCPPCREEIPELISIRKAYPADKVVIVGISLDSDRGKLESFAEAMNFNYPVYLAEPDVPARFPGLFGGPDQRRLPPEGRKSMNLSVRKARMGDIRAIHALLMTSSADGLLLPRSLTDLYGHLRDFFVVEGDGATVGCGALSIIWENMAEVRSLAVAAHARRKGCGRLIVEACIAEARELDIHRLFALTYQLPFFNALGFSIVEKEVLPQKVWVDCVNCPKFPDCDETAVLLEI